MASVRTTERPLSRWYSLKWRTLFTEFSEEDDQEFFESQDDFWTKQVVKPEKRFNMKGVKKNSHRLLVRGSN